jgi:hypothetical protein
MKGEKLMICRSMALGSVSALTVAFRLPCSRRDGAQNEPSRASDQPVGLGSEALPTSEILVTGVRASLSSAQERKQSADAVVDSIIAEDTGSFPTTRCRTLSSA